MPAFTFRLFVPVVVLPGGLLISRKSPLSSPPPLALKGFCGKERHGSLRLPPPCLSQQILVPLCS